MEPTKLLSPASEFLPGYSPDTLEISPRPHPIEQCCIQSGNETVRRCMFPYFPTLPLLLASINVHIHTNISKSFLKIWSHLK